MNTTLWFRDEHRKHRRNFHPVSHSPPSPARNTTHNLHIESSEKDFGALLPTHHTRGFQRVTASTSWKLFPLQDIHRASSHPSLHRHLQHIPLLSIIYSPSPKSLLPIHYPPYSPASAITRTHPPWFVPGAKSHLRLHLFRAISVFQDGKLRFLCGTEC